MYQVDGNWIELAGTFTLAKSAGVGARAGQRLVDGVACTPTRDLHGEIVRPLGLELSYFARHGRLNWDHGKGPGNIIGEPVDWKQTAKQLWLQGRVYEGIPKADEAWALFEARVVLAWSVEGKVLERDPKDKTIVTRALVVNCAITHNPVNPDTNCQISEGMAKALEMAGSPSLAGGMTTTTGGLLVPESLEGAHHEVLSKHLAKSRQACGCLTGSGDGMAFASGYDGAVAHFAMCCGAPAPLAMALAKNHDGVARATGQALARKE